MGYQKNDLLQIFYDLKVFMEYDLYIFSLYSRSFDSHNIKY